MLRSLVMASSVRAIDTPRRVDHMSRHDHTSDFCTARCRRPWPGSGHRTLQTSDLPPPRPHDPVTARARRTRRALKDFRSRRASPAGAALRPAPGLMLLAVIAVIAGLSPVFLTTRNVGNVLSQSAVIAVLALAQLLVIVTRGIDLSVGSTLALSAVVGALVFASMP